MHFAKEEENTGQEMEKGNSPITGILSLRDNFCYNLCKENYRPISLMNRRKNTISLN